MRKASGLVGALMLCASFHGISNAMEVVLQPGPGEGKDIWTTSYYSYAPGGGGPGGGLDNEHLRVGGWGDYYQSLIEFNLAGLPTNAISARIDLYGVPGTEGYGATEMYLDRITAFWDWRIQGTGRDRDRLWWADRPPAVQVRQIPAPTMGQWYSIDITDLYNQWQSGVHPNYGIQLRPVRNWNNYSTFFSSDYTNDPALRAKLVVEYVPAAEPPPVGTVVAWGNNSYGQGDVPADLTNAVSVAAGLYFSMALRADGTVAAWGQYYTTAFGGGSYAPMFVPAGLSDVKRISAGGNYAVALRADGTLVAWGNNDYGQCNVGSFTGIVSVTAGDDHALAVVTDGTAVAWGKNSASYGERVIPAGLTGVVAVAAGYQHSAVLLANGTVVAWGWNAYGQTNVPPSLTNAVAIVSGWNHNLALRADGTVVAWGDNGSGQCNVPAGLSGVVAIAAHQVSSVALRSDGTVVAWGGAAAVPSGLEGVLAISAGRQHNLALVAASETGDTTPPEITGCDDMIVSCAETSGAVVVYSAVVTDDTDPNPVVAYDPPSGSLLPVGQTLVQVTATDAAGNSGSCSFNVRVITDTSLSSAAWPQDVTAEATGPLTAVDLNQPVVVDDCDPDPTITNNAPAAYPVGQTLVTWTVTDASGNGETYEQTVTVTDTTAPAIDGCSDRAVSAGDPAGAIVTYSASVTDLVDPNPAVTYSPPSGSLLPPGDTEVTVTAADVYGNTSTCRFVVMVSGPKFLAWGRNDYGQCTAPEGLTGEVTAIAGGELHTLVLLADGTVTMWGNNSYAGYVPAGLSDVVAIAAGSYHSLALKADGTVAAWGLNGYGETAVPSGLSGVVAVSAGTYHSVALKSDGTVSVWGRNNYGQLNVPSGLSNVVAISARQHHTLALRSDGSVVAWGYNGFGQCNVPAGLANVVAVSAGGQHSLALRADGTVVAWGYNNQGQIDVPAGLSRVVGIAAGEYHNLALLADGEVVGWGNDAYGQATAPAGWPPVESIASGYNFSLAIVGDGVPADTVPPALSVPQDIVAQATQQAGAVVDFTVTATDLMDPNPTLTLSHASGSAFPIGETTVIATATDASGNSATASFTVTVLDGVPPSITGCEDITVIGWNTDAVAVAYAVAIQDEDPLATVVVDPPSGSLFRRGETVVTVTAWDSAGHTNTCQFTVRVVLNTTTTRLVAWGQNPNLMPAGLAGVTTMSAGAEHYLALRRNGSVVAWGRSNEGQINVPAGLTSVVAVAAGGYHSMALKADGTVACWGNNVYGLASAPAGLSNVTAIAAGGSHSLALRSDGVVVAWGNNYDGQCSVPAGLTDVVAISAGNYHSLALRADGTVVAWGALTRIYGQCDVPAGLANVVAISAGGLHSLALRADGTAVSWGWATAATLPAGLTNIVKISAGEFYSLALRSDGTVISWGRNDYGQVPVPAGLVDVVEIDAGSRLSLALVGDGTPEDHTPPSIRFCDDLRRVAAEASGVLVDHRVGVTDDSDPIPTVVYDPPSRSILPPGDHVVSVTVWDDEGNTNSCEFTVTVELDPYATTLAAWGSDRTGLTNVVALADFQRISAGPNHNLAVRSDGSLYGWGRNLYGSLDIPVDLRHVTDVSGGRVHSIALRADGTVVAWGGVQTGSGIVTASVPVGLSNVVALDATEEHDLALHADGTVTAWGTLYIGGVFTPAYVPAGLANVIAIAAGKDHDLALRADGTVVAWGDNSQGECNVPAGLNDAIAIAAGDNYSVALRANGTVLAWGDNAYEQCSAPAGLTDVVAIAAGSYHGLAVRSDGSVVAWGTAKGGVNILPAGLSNVVAVSAATTHGLAIVQPRPAVDATPPEITVPANIVTPATGPDGARVSFTVSATDLVDANPTVSANPASESLFPVGDTTVTVTAADASGNTATATFTVTVTPWIAPIRNTVVAWGGNNQGQTAVPGGLSNVARIEAGMYRSLALQADGTVVTWGAGAGAAAGLSDVVSVAAGENHTLALRSDGTVVASGNNGYGESTVPAGLEDVVAVAAGYSFSLALRSDGTVVAWGRNWNGECNVPPGVRDVVAIAAGQYHGVALRSDGTVVAWGWNQHGQRNVPDGLAGVVAIAAGHLHSLALRSDGTVAAWGATHDGACDVPAGLADVVAIAAGGNHSMALRSDGTVVAWGWNESGQINVPSGLTGVVAISAGLFHSLALVADEGVADLNPPGLFNCEPRIVAASTLTGTPFRVLPRVFDDADPRATVESDPPFGTFLSMGAHEITWTARDNSGNTNVCQFTLNVAPDTEAPVLSGCEDRIVTALDPSGLAAGGWVVVTDNADPNPAVVYDPATLPVGETTVTATATDIWGNSGSCQFTVTVKYSPVVAWGDNWVGQCDVPDGLGDVVAIAAAETRSLALRADGTLAIWGFNAGGEGEAPADLNDVVAVSAGSWHNLALRADGTVVAWGESGDGEDIVPVGLTDVVQVAGGGNHSLALRSDGTLVGWGANDQGQCDAPEGVGTIVAISAGDEHSLALLADGTVVAWGYNDYGQCDVPAGLTDVVAIAGGGYHSLALRSDGTVVAWGYNEDGQCDVPENLTDVVAISATGNGFHSLALRADGSVVAWGYNSEGQTEIPAGLPSASAVVAGGYHSLALLARTPPGGDTTPPALHGCGDRAVIAGKPAAYMVRVFDDVDPSPTVTYDPPLGTVLPEGDTQVTVTATDASENVATCQFVVSAVRSPIVAWGGNWNGETDVPADLVEVAAIAAGDSHNLALRPDGTVAAWGWNEYGQCDVPPSLTDAVAISAGGAFSAALRSNGTVAVWGQYYDGSDMLPMEVPEGLADVVDIDAGYYHIVALRADGTVAAWGWNDYGQCDVPEGLTGVIAVEAGYGHTVALLSDGSVVLWGDDFAGGVVPDGLSNVTAISAGMFHTLALRTDGTLVAWGDNWAGQLDVPAGLDDVVAMVGGDSHSLAIRSDGTVEAWGYGDDGQCDVPAGLSNVVAVAAGYGASLALIGDADFMPPTIGGCDPIAISCAPASGVAVTFAVTVTDNADPNPAVVYDPPSGSVFPPGETVVNVMATDAAGRSSACSFTVTVAADAAAPALEGVPADATVACGAIPAPVVVTATDACDGTVSVSFAEASGVVEGCGTIVRTWRSTDLAGNTAIQTQTLTVVDLEKPRLIGVPADETVSSDAIPAPPVVTATDNCDPTLTVGFIEVINLVDGAGTIVRTWTVVDQCGNSATASQTLTVESVGNLSVPDFQQYGEIWSKDLLNNWDGRRNRIYTIESYGNQVVTLAQVLSFHGIPSRTNAILAMDPRVLNLDMTGNTNAYPAKSYRINQVGAAFQYGLNVEFVSSSDQNLLVAQTEAILGQGEPVMMQMERPGITNGGHQVVAWGVDGTGELLVNDPGSNDVQTLTAAMQSYGALVGGVWTPARLDKIGFVGSAQAMLVGFGYCPVELILMDAEGRVTGYDELHPSAQPGFLAKRQEIPSSGYHAEGAGPDDSFRSFYIMRPAGRYPLKVVGTAAAPYTLVFYVRDADGEVSQVTLEGLASEGSVQEYVLDYDQARVNAPLVIEKDDVEPPTLSGCADLEVAPTGLDGAVVDFAVTATDNAEPPPVVTYSHEPGTRFPVGDTFVTATATDASGNQSTCSFTVTVLDTTPPAIQCPPDVTVGVLPVVDTSGVVATDSSGAVTVMHAGDRVTGTGCVTVVQRSYTAVDVHGNTATCTQTITVIPLVSPVDPVLWLQPLARAGMARDTDPGTGGTLKYSFKAGSTIPIQVVAQGCTVPEVTDSPNILGEVNLYADVNGDSLPDGNEMAIDYNGVGGAGGGMIKVDGKLKYNLDTKSLVTAGCYVLEVVITDASTGESRTERLLLQRKK